MASRKTVEDVARAVLDPGFTPSARDAKALVTLLGSDDEAVAKGAERALVRLGPTWLADVGDAARGASGIGRARVVRAAGAIAAAGPGSDEALAFVVRALEDADARVVRYAASALGKMRDRRDEAERALVAAWGRAGHEGVRRVIAEALGKIGGDAARALLEAHATSGAELARVVAQAKLRLERTSLRATEASAIEAGVTLDRPTAVVFRCREGLESIVVDELGDSWSPRATDAGRVRAVLRGPLASAWGSRVALDFSVLLGPVARGEDLGETLVGLLSSDAAWRALRGFTRGPVRYRLAFEGGGHKRALVARVATEVRARRAELVNDPTESPWEALVVEREADGEREGKGGGGFVSIELAPRGLEDPRFPWRVADVPAASHPTIAAALARVGGVREDDVVWDPFVGSALELIERAKMGPWREMHGTDVDARALESARANLSRAGVEGVQLFHGDSTQRAPRGVTLVVTNPPMGRRVARGELAMLLDRFVHRVGEAVGKGGRLVWLSPMPERTRARLEAVGFGIEVARSVDMGGFRAELQRGVKR